MLPFACSCSVGLLGTRALGPQETGGGITRPEETLQTKRKRGNENHSSLKNALSSPPIKLQLVTIGVSHERRVSGVTRKRLVTARDHMVT